MARRLSKRQGRCRCYLDIIDFLVCEHIYYKCSLFVFRLVFLIFTAYHLILLDLQLLFLSGEEDFWIAKAKFGENHQVKIYKNEFFVHYSPIAEPDKRINKYEFR